jgi:hypothetical protein
MKVNELVLEALDEYHERSLLMQKVLYDKTLNMSKDELKEKVNDDLIFHVPIYDMLDRKYAAFSSFPEALHKKNLDPKGHGKRYENHKVTNEFDWFMFLYLFRLCGSGINYKPDSHGFGNFWINNSILNEKYTYQEWLQDIPKDKFCDNKGYLLPQFSIGLRSYILKYSKNLVEHLYTQVKTYGKHNIIEFVNKGNEWLNFHDFKRQTFVLSAFAADIAEYFPEYVEQNSMIYAGTNAKKCIKAIFGKCDEFEAIDFLSKRYEAPPYSVEDSRLCDPVRYFLEYQSKYHIERNDGNIYKNNSLIKTKWKQEEYQSFLSQLRK